MSQKSQANIDIQIYNIMLEEAYKWEKKNTNTNIHHTNYESTVSHNQSESRLQRKPSKQTPVHLD